ncbi:MAG: four helix bundle protein [Melioribacteraceae bacterium]|nr:four helix bundle protein [Melioribacteraceae bacterium]
MNAIDSISANIAEGFGRFGKKDKIKFYRIAFGSMYEALDWTEKAIKRKLISDDEYKYIFSELNKLPKEIHSLIKFTNDKLKE